MLLLALFLFKNIISKIALSVQSNDYKFSFFLPKVYMRAVAT